MDITAHTHPMYKPGRPGVQRHWDLGEMHALTVQSRVSTRALKKGTVTVRVYKLGVSRRAATRACQERGWLCDTVAAHRVCARAHSVQRDEPSVRRRAGCAKVARRENEQHKSARALRGCPRLAQSADRSLLARHEKPPCRPPALLDVRPERLHHLRAGHLVLAADRGEVGGERLGGEETNALLLHRRRILLARSLRRLALVNALRPLAARVLHDLLLLFLLLFLLLLGLLLLFLLLGLLLLRLLGLLRLLRRLLLRRLLLGRRLLRPREGRLGDLLLHLAGL